MRVDKEALEILKSTYRDALIANGDVLSTVLHYRCCLTDTSKPGSKKRENSVDV